ncbi:hypothetical protein Clacol_005228 [Clathrus columnatus]|uniref:Uncharacterized protein n=1 Tax=Clathrus columnatus TaxID=1419009 RepID=A0AAV5ACT6_9AGAM|nr:hypothetical protein Clacol_005228 [Clathrus columnatus]
MPLKLETYKKGRRNVETWVQKKAVETDEEQGVQEIRRIVLRVILHLQPNVRTIEGVLFEAMVKVGAVSQGSVDDPVKVHTWSAHKIFQRRKKLLGNIQWNIENFKTSEMK